MAMSSSPSLSKLTGTDDFCSVAENSIKNPNAEGWPHPSAPEGTVMQSSFRKDDSPFLSKQSPFFCREENWKSFANRHVRLPFCSLATNLGEKTDRKYRFLHV